jgi:hypothetical protein
MERTGNAPAARLPELLAAFGCAPDAEAFGSKGGELICGHRIATVTQTAAKYRLWALPAQSRDPYARDVLTELAEEFIQAARRAERLVKRAA